MTELGAGAQRNPATGIPALVVAGGFLAAAGFVANLAVGKTRKTPPKGISSSVLFVLDVNNDIARDTYKYSASRIVRQRHRRRRGIDDAEHLRAVLGAARALPDGSRLQNTKTPSQSDGPQDSWRGSALLRTQTHAADGRTSPLGTTTAADMATGAGEIRRRRWLDVRQEIGLAPLGLVANQIWHDDPRLLVYLLSRYKFVAKMLTGRRFVAEVGCGDAFPTRLLLQEVDQVTVYDLDPSLIEDIRLRRSERWPIDAYVHDIVLAPLQRSTTPSTVWTSSSACAERTSTGI